MKNSQNRLRTLAALTAALLATHGAFAATTATWSGTGGNKNWSTPGNWSGSQPGATVDVKFYDTGADATVGNVNNIVDANTSVLSLQYGNTNLSHTTLINPGVTLTNLGNLVAGTETLTNPSPAITTTITGPGGRLVVNNSSASVFVRQNSGLTTLDMSGLDTFIATVSTVQAGTYPPPTGANKPQGVFLLAKTNFITASGGTPAINIGLSAANNGAGSSKISLGQTNVIFANSIAVGRQKQTGCSLVFNPAFTSPFAYFRALDGVSRVATWAIGNGENNSGTTSCNGTCDFTGGTVDAQVSTMTVGRASDSTSGSTSATSHGTLTFDRGTIDVDTLQVGLQTANNYKSGDGVVNVRGTATLVVNSSLQLAQTTGGTGAGATTGKLNIDGGTVRAATITSGNASTTASTISLVNGGTLALSGTAGTPSNPLCSFSLSDSTLSFSTLDAATTNIFVTTLTPGGATNVIAVDFFPSITSYPVTFHLIKYDPGYTYYIPDIFGLTNLAAGYTAYVTNDTSSSSINLVVTTGPIPKAITWTGTPNGNWDTSTMNWLAGGVAANFNRGDFATFDDSASGTTSVTLPGPVYPGSLTVNNSAKTYTFSGSGKLGGTTGLTKQGTGTLVIDNSISNDFTGDVLLNQGTIQVGNGDSNGALGKGDVVNNAALVFNRSNAVSFGNVMSGAGTLTQNGIGTLTVSGANNGYTGAVTVAQSMLKLGNVAALGSSTACAGVTIASGATLDINGFAPVNLPVTVSGNGVDGNGAIINSGASKLPAFNHVTLAGDAAFGGSGFVSGGGRWDIRLSNSGATDPSQVSLSTGGHGYNLTKVGSNYVGICNATVDPALGNIDIQGGTLSFQYNNTGFGNPASTLTVESGAMLELYSLTNLVNKIFVLNGNGTNTTINNGAGANTVLGPVTLNGAVVINAGGTSLTLNGNIDGTGSLNKIGGSSLILNGANTYTGATIVTNGTLLVNGNNSGGGQLTNTPGSTVGGNGTYTGPVTVGGTLNPGAVGAAGTFTTGPLTFVAGATPVFDLNATSTAGSGVNDLLQVNGDLTVNNTTININMLEGYLHAGTYRLMTYTGSLVGSFNPAVALVGGGLSRFTFQVDTSVPGQVNLVVSGSTVSLKWNSTSSSTWDVAATANWLNLGNGLNSTFYQGDSVLLDDSVPGVQTSLVLATNVAPAPLTVNASVNNYSITGNGKITDGASIIKQGTGTLLLGSANDFNGSVLVQAGILQVTNNGALGTVNGGTIISSGATLDICGVAVKDTLNLGQEPITVSGPGVGGNGAIINSGAYSQYNSIRNITLAGDATFGGPGQWSTSGNNPGRWDVRGGSAVLNTGGNAYNLTKVGSNQVSIVAATVDPALADIDVQGGLLGFETSTTSMGNPTNTLTVRAGATLSFYQTTVLLDKVLVLYGDGATSTVYNWSGSNTFIGPVTLNDGCVFNMTSTGLTLTNVVGGSGSLLKTGSGPLSLYGANTYSGNTQVKAGTLALVGTGSIANSPSISLAAGTTLDVSGRTDDTLTLTGTQALSGSGTVSGNLVAGPGTTVAAGDTTASTLTVTSNATLNGNMNVFTVNPGGVGDSVLAVTNNLNVSGIPYLYINVTGLLSVNETHTIMTYGGSLVGNAASFLVLASPGYSFAVETTTAHAVVVRVTAVPANLFWVGNQSGTWDTTTLNWVGPDYYTPTSYSDFQVVNFGDYNPTPVRTQLTLQGTYTPAAINFNNYSSAYTFTGPGKLTGGAALNQQGTGPIILDNGGNDYTGGTTFSGILQVGNNDTNGGIGSGPISANGTLVFARSDDVIVSNAISGYGSFTNLGTGRVTLTASNGLQGDFTVARGTVRVDNVSALGPSSSYGGIRINTGATLDVGGPHLAENALAITTKTVTVSGAGVGGQGAIINSSTNRQYNALRTVTLAGDTTFGGPGSWSTSAQPGRWDIRYTPTSGTSGALGTGGSAYSLTKVGSNQVSLVGVTVDPALGHIDVQGGVFGFEGGTTSMGDPTSNLVVRAGAAISFYSTTTPWNKVFLLYGDGTNPTIFNWNGNNTMVGPVTLNGGCVFSGYSGTLTNNGAIGGSGSLVKSGPSTLILNGANSYAGSTVVNNGRLVFATGSTMPASPVFDLAGTNGILDLSGIGGALTLNSGQSLQGNGALYASLTANAGSTVLPGEAQAIGTLTISNNVSLNGSTVMELDRNAVGGSDQIKTPGALSVNGTLTITNIGAPLAAGDTFKLFNAGTLNGSALSSVVLPALGPGLAWNNTLAANGQISVYATVSITPTRLGCLVSGKQLTISWPSDHTGWRLVTNSVDVANTNFWFTYPGSSSMNQVIINVDPSQPKVFYRLVYP